MQHPVARQGLDHIMIILPDLAAGRDALHQLGFQTTATGRHPVFGSANHLAILQEDYIEILAIEEDLPAGRAMRDAVTNLPGLYGIALATMSADEDYRRLQASGVGTGAPMDYGRPLEVDGRWYDAKFRSTPVNLDYLPGCYPFFCDHATPDLVWRPADMIHANGAIGIRELVAVVAEPAQSCDRFRAMIDPAMISPAPFAAGRSEAGFTAAGYSFRFLTASAFAARFPGVAMADIRSSAAQVEFPLIIVETRNLAAARAAITVPLVQEWPDGSLLTVRLPSLSCAFLFVAG
jgi:Glyoxalase-like domain